jgi:hypothetical protein
LRALHFGLGGLVLLVLATFFDVLFVPGARVVGSESADMARQFLPWRDFGFNELAKGNLALWNPHNYSGAPFFGGMQSALLYPPNALFLVLPLPLAANWSVALNAFLLGAFMYWWTLRRGLHPFAAFVAAALLMFSAPYFLRLYAGHVTSMAAMAWVPLIFLAIDEWLASRRPGWVLLGMLAVAMQILAGHPQTVHLTALMAGFYALLRLFTVDADRLRAAAGLLSFYVGGALLAALQLLVAFQAASESVRSAGVPYEFAVYFSFPPENLVTLLAPAFFGDPYWGRWYLWEASAFMGVIGFALACYGIAKARLSGKNALLATAVGATLLAFGDNTPLFRLAFDWLPWLDRFRGAGKFFFITTFILAFFAGCGLDRALRHPVSRRTLWTLAGCAAALAAVAVFVRFVDWRPLANAVMASGQTYLDRASYGDAGFVAAAQRFAALGVALAAATLAAAAAILLWTRREPRAVFLLGILAVAEIFAFARLNRPTFEASHIVVPQLAQFLAANPGDYRILNLTRFPNSAVSMRAFDAWGYDPAVTRRYAEFITWSAGNDPAQTIEYVAFRQFHPLLAMLRVKYVVVQERDAIAIHPGGTPPLKRLELIGAYQVQSGRSAILRAMDERSFDPAKQAILEREPTPRPIVADTQGRARIVREGSDFLEIDADIASPSLLLVTDAWTPAWRAVSREASDARRYEVVPANYVLRAVPLDRGAHRLRLEYAPAALGAGAAVSAAAWAAWLAAGLLLWVRAKGRTGA